MPFLVGRFAIESGVLVKANLSAPVYQYDPNLEQIYCDFVDMKDAVSFDMSPSEASIFTRSECLPIVELRSPFLEIPFLTAEFKWLSKGAASDEETRNLCN